MPDFFRRLTISADLAHRLISSAENVVDEIVDPICTLVVDESGVLKAMNRMEGLSREYVEIALRQAVLALAGDPLLAALPREIAKDEPGLKISGPSNVVARGLPVTVQRQVIGAVGISTRATSLSAMERAYAAVANTVREISRPNT